MRQVLCAALVVFALYSPAYAQQQPPTAVPVGVIKTERRPIAQSGEYVGRVEAISRVEIRARITGFLEEVLFKATFGASGLIHSAQAMSLGTTPMIGFDPVGVSREFSLSDNEVPALLVAVGYPTEANWPQKPRRPISDVLAFA